MSRTLLTLKKSAFSLDRVLVVVVSIYCLGLFLPAINAIERICLTIAVVISCTNGRWRTSGRYLRHPVIVLTYLLIGWFGLSTIWSVDPVITRSSWWSVFKDFFLILPAICYLLDDAQRRSHLTTALGICGAVIVTINAAQYLREFLVDPQLLLNIKTHRGWAHPLVFFVPFAIAKATTTNGRSALMWYGLFGIESTMILATGARGAWLALFAEILVLGMTRGLWRKAAVLMSSLLVIFVIAFATLPSNLIKDRVRQGADTSLRTTGTWGPAIEMMNERPWFGFGFGKAIFDAEFNTRAPQMDHWSIKKSKGPHSILFEAGFAGGYPGLLMISALFVAAVAYGANARRNKFAYQDRAFVLSAWASFIGFYAVRGTLESPHWAPMIILLIGIASFAQTTADQVLAKRTTDR